MNYGELLTRCARQVMRTDLTTDWPLFIRRAHDAIGDEMLLCAVVELVDGEAALPEGCGEIVSLWMGGAPHDFSVEGSTIKAGNGEGRLVYRPARDFFADEAATNTVLTAYPMAYLYGAVAEARRFLRDYEDARVNEDLFRAEIARASNWAMKLATRDITPRPGVGR